jgi:hypothetical protein
MQSKSAGGSKRDAKKAPTMLFDANSLKSLLGGGGNSKNPGDKKVRQLFTMHQFN